MVILEGERGISASYREVDERKEFSARKKKKRTQREACKGKKKKEP